MTTYVFLAILVSGVFNTAFTHSDTKAYISSVMLLTAAMLFVASAIPAIGRVFPWLFTARISLPYGQIERFASRFFNSSGIFRTYILGVVLGFMPCGLVVAALLAVSTAPSVTVSAIAMAMFCLGTVPALWIVGAFGNVVQKKFPVFTKAISPSIMAFSGVLLFFLAFRVSAG